MLAAHGWMRLSWPLWLFVHVIVLWRGLGEQLSVLDVPCRGCPSVFRLSGEEQVALSDAGVDIALYRWFVVVVVVGFAAGCWSLGWALVYRARPGSWPVVAGFLLVSLGAVRWIEEVALRSVDGLAGVAAMVASVGNYVAPVALFALFPDGRWVPRWSRWAVVAVAAWATVLAATPLGDDLAAGRAPVTPLDGAVFLATLVAILGWQVSRYRAGGDVVRAQCRWVVASLLISAAMFVPVVVVGNLEVYAAPLFRMVALGAVIGAMFLVVISLAAAVLRHGLWNLDLVFWRALVSGGLTAALVSVYAAAIGLAAEPLARAGPWAVAVGLAAVAAALEPLRRRLQAAIGRLVYGPDEITLVAISSPLAADPQGALDRTAASIAAQTGFLGVRIEVNGSGGTALVGESGELGPGAAMEMPLLVDGEIVGSLRTSMRRGQRRVRGADEAMLRRLTAPLSSTAAIARLVHLARTVDTQMAASLSGDGPAAGVGASPEVPNWLKLNDRERLLLARLSFGCTNAQIADELGISQKTVRNQLSLLYAKLAVVDRSQAALAARDLGF